MAVFCSALWSGFSPPLTGTHHVHLIAGLGLDQGRFWNQQRAGLLADEYAHPRILPRDQLHVTGARVDVGEFGPCQHLIGAGVDLGADEIHAAAVGIGAAVRQQHLHFESIQRSRGNDPFFHQLLNAIQLASTDIEQGVDRIDLNQRGQNVLVGGDQRTDVDLGILDATVEWRFDFCELDIELGLLDVGLVVSHGGTRLFLLGNGVFQILNGRSAGFLQSRVARDLFLPVGVVGLIALDQCLVACKRRFG